MLKRNFKWEYPLASLEWPSLCCPYGSKYWRECHKFWGVEEDRGTTKIRKMDRAFSRKSWTYPPTRIWGFTASCLTSKSAEPPRPRFFCSCHLKTSGPFSEKKTLQCWFADFNPWWIPEQKLSTSGAQFLKAFHIYERSSTANVSWIFHEIFFVVFALKLEHVFKSYDHSNFGQIWAFSRKSHKLQKKEKTFRYNFYRFESGLKHLIFTIF